MECPSCHTQVDASQRFCPTCGAALAGAAQSPPRDAPPEGSIIGQTLGGKYKVVRLLGEGGMGAVFEGEQQLGTARRKVAIKTLHPHLSRDSKIQARFEREVGTVAELEHPNTIQVYDFGANEAGILYIVMEFLQGKSLATLLEKEGPMAADRVDRILQQIFGSLEEAHGRGIVHRDLKPDNVVLVDRAGKKDFVKVLDFGIAKRSNESDSGEQKLTQQGMVLGTPPYMSPEQFSGRPIDARSDIYSLGIMAYEMLSGRLPFHGNTAWEWATQHMTQAPYPLEALPEGARVPDYMRSAIQQALAKSPDERFQSVREFAEAFSGATNKRAFAPTAAVARQKTELGAPLDVAGAFGGPGAAPAVLPAVNPQSHTPSGNVSFPTPAAIPQPPPRDVGSGKGSRAGLLAAAGLIAVASIGAIAFAMRGGTKEKEVVFDQGVAPAPAMSVTASTVGSGEATAAAAGGVDVPPLSGGNAHTTPRPAALQRPSSTAAPTASANPGTAVLPAVPPAPTPAPLPPVPPPPPRPAAKYDGPECVNARRLRAIGHPREAESLALACIAKGGTP